MMTNNTMLKECAITAIISMEELKNLGIVPMISFMQVECAKIATSIATIRKKEKRNNYKKATLKWMDRSKKSLRILTKSDFLMLLFIKDQF